MGSLRQGAASRLWIAIAVAVLSPWLLPGAEPANNSLAKAQRLTGPQGSVTGSTVDATAQAGEPVHAGAGIGKSVWYRWRSTSPATVVFSTEGSGFDTVLAIYKGSTLASLTPVASNDDVAPGQLTSRVSFSSTEGVDYLVAVDAVLDPGFIQLTWSSIPSNDLFDNFRLLQGTSGALTGDSTGATLQDGESPPVAADVGATLWFAWAPTVSGLVTFKTAGSGFDTILGAYRGDGWASLEELISDDNGQGIDLSSEITWQAEAGSRYRILLGGRNQAQGLYRLSWHQIVPPPANDNFSDAVALSGATGQRSGENSGATTEPGEPLNDGSEPAASVWFTWTAPRSGIVRWDTLRGLFPGRVTAYQGSAVDSLIPVSQSGGAGACVFQAVAGLEYRVAVDGENGASGAYLLQWNFDDLKTPGNAFADAVVLFGIAGKAASENFHADLEPGEPAHADDPGGRSIWFKWKALEDVRVRWTTDGSNFDTLLAVYTGDDLLSGLTRIAANDDDDTRLISTVSFDAVAGTTYRIAVDASSDRGRQVPAVGAVELRWAPSSSDRIGLTPIRGLIGSWILISGTDLTDVTSVAFNGVEAEFLTEEGRLLAKVPSGAGTGLVEVSLGDGTVRSTVVPFTVVPGSPPVLSVRTRAPGQIQIAWSSQFPQFQLQWSDAIQENGWGFCEPPLQVGGEYVVEEPLTPGTRSRFYRLVLP